MEDIGEAPNVRRNSSQARGQRGSDSQNLPFDAPAMTDNRAEPMRRLSGSRDQAGQITSMQAQRPTALPQRFTRDQALEVLRSAIGSRATFHEHQWEAIDACLNGTGNTLVVQRTGWGKSAVYFTATKLLRRTGAGPTLVISPLLSLMRNQTHRAREWGLEARTVNSDNGQKSKDGRSPWEEIRAEISENKIDLLIISPERLHAKPFVEDFLPSISGNCQLLVVDEAHCISDWGHDFRPEYRMIRRAVAKPAAGMRLLCTTATANNRVIKDLECTFDGNVRTIRGTLDRPGLCLDVIDLPSASHRLAWIAQAVQTGALAGSGIVYALTRRDAIRVNRWLISRGIRSACYVGGGSTEEDRADRTEIEDRLLSNDLQAVVATQALGMGFDKPDLAWIVHYQAPGSPVLWYQQVGRAGRNLPRSVGVMLQGKEDRRINEFFANGSFPTEPEAERILGALADLGGSASEDDIADESNVRGARIGAMLKLLASLDDAPVQGIGRRHWRLTANPLRYPRELVAKCARQRHDELNEMTALLAGSGCLMQSLRMRLNDAGAVPCGRCGRCMGAPIVKARIPDETLLAAMRFDRDTPTEIRPKRQWANSNRKRDRLGSPFAPACRIPVEHRAEPGRFLSYWGLDEIGRSLMEHDGVGAAEFDPMVVAALLEFLRTYPKWPAARECRWIALVPSRKRAAAMAALARTIGESLDMPFVPNAVVRTSNLKARQQDCNSRFLLTQNALNSFRVDETLVRPEPVLLLDDCVDSGWTFTAIAAMLRMAGSGPVFPLALSSTMGAGGNADDDDAADD